MAFRAFTMFCNHYLYLVPNMLSLLKESVPIMNLHSISPLSQLLATTTLPSVSINLAALGISYVCACVLSYFSRVLLFGTLWTVAQQAPLFIYGILQARILEWVAISFSRGSSRPRD